MRDLVLGAGRLFDKRLCAKMVAATVVGLILQAASVSILFPDPTATMQLNSIGVVPIVVNIVLCLGLLWMQTTSEEILFRCPFLRAGGGNGLEPSAKLVAWGVASCAIFMLMHAGNPEMRAQGDALTAAAMLVSYLIPAVGMYVADVVYCSPLAGCAHPLGQRFRADSPVLPGGNGRREWFAVLDHWGDKRYRGPRGNRVPVSPCGRGNGAGRA